MSNIPFENYTVTAAPGTYNYTVAPHVAGSYGVVVSDTPQRTPGTAAAEYNGTASFECREPRPYFHIFTAQAYSAAATRLIQAPGIRNFRDLGGYNTADGRFVRWGAVFRSADLDEITAQGAAVLGALGIRHIVDLRCKRELRGRALPDVPGAAVEMQPAVDYDERESVLDVMDFYGSSEEKLFDTVYRGLGYERMPFSSVGLQRVFALLFAGDGPVLFHCASGKDRTGTAAALFLRALGVPMATIEHDYMLSNILRGPQGPQTVQMFREYGFSETALQLVTELVMVRIENLRLMFASIAERYDSFESYLDAELGVGARELAKLKEKYLITH